MNIILLIIMLINTLMLILIIYDSYYACYNAYYSYHYAYYCREWGLESPAIKHNNSYTKNHARKIIPWKVCHFWAPRCQETRNAMEHPCAEAAPTVTFNPPDHVHSIQEGYKNNCVSSPKPPCQETWNAMEHPCAEAAPTITFHLADHETEGFGRISSTLQT